MESSYMLSLIKWIYKRHIGTIYLGNYNINQSIVQNGYAWAFREYLTDPNYIKYEQYARQNRLGLWKDNNPIGEFKHEVRQFQKPYDNQQAEQISLMV